MNCFPKNGKNRTEELSDGHFPCKTAQKHGKTVGDPDICQVMRGGFAVSEVEPSTMEVRSIKGLHIVGEALDVDGPCGGFNLHWAWASAALCCREIVRKHASSR